MHGPQRQPVPKHARRHSVRTLHAPIKAFPPLFPDQFIRPIFTKYLLCIGRMSSALSCPLRSQASGDPSLYPSEQTETPVFHIVKWVLA